MEKELEELEKESFNNMFLLNDNEFYALVDKYNENREGYINIVNNPDLELSEKESLKKRYKIFNQLVEEYINGKTINNNIEVEQRLLDEQYEEKSSAMIAA